MREKPILFSGPMVRAILDGTKTQTRRLAPDFAQAPVEYGDGEWHEVVHPPGHGGDWARPFKSQPHAVGDTLWVKETWRTLSAFDGSSPQSVGEQSGVPHARAAGPVMYDADGAHNDEWARWLRSPLAAAAKPGKTRVSIHMPRWASRLTLRVTDVRIERLGDISEADARAEGLRLHAAGWTDGVHGYDTLSARDAFAELWEHVHGDGTWERDRSKWVWVYGFEVMR